VLIALLVVCSLGAYTGVRAVHQLGRAEAAGFAGLFQYPAWSAAHFVAGVVFSVLGAASAVGVDPKASSGRASLEWARGPGDVRCLWG
jgi:hypothetical protein